jgi:hypothetical protein
MARSAGRWQVIYDLLARLPSNLLSLTEWQIRQEDQGLDHHSYSQLRGVKDIDKLCSILLGATYLTLLLSAPGEGKGEPVFETGQRKRWREWMLRMPPSKS